MEAIVIDHVLKCLCLIEKLSRAVDFEVPIELYALLYKI